MKKKNKSHKVVLLALVLLLSLVVTVGYAALTSDITINGNTKVSTNNWKLIVSSVSGIGKSAGTTVTTAPSATESENKVSISYNVELSKPGDYYEFTFTVKNGGSLKASLSNVKVEPTLTAAEKKYLSHTITETNGSAVATNNVLNSGDTHSYKVRVEYKDVSSASDLPTSDVTKTMKITLTYSQV